MKQNTSKWKKVMGWMLFLVAIGFFCMQIGYLVLHERFQVEYVDNRLFYIINIVCLVCLTLAILLLLQSTRKFIMIISSISALLIIGHVFLLISSNNEIKNITSISPDWKHVLSIKENMESGEAIYYRSYYGILARPKEVLPEQTIGEYQVEWLAEDVGAVTYKAANNTTQQFIATYGDRGSGISYYYVGAQTHGNWQGDNVELVSGPEGITVTENGEAEIFQWDDIHQFGTLAIVLKKNGEAAWTIALHENFQVDTGTIEANDGNILLYKATMENAEPIVLSRS
ncbi:hypothetical protein [Oceanobacillus profundus]|uniref:Uncharacterized protein n=1 Tax=Oceanobacillus profundus TaxID=372463 RepID=A0A417YAF1_9BACI|nr:hypothetical protein [Oceanobacillus profundus]MBR3119022.1 hypothetical protein [Oceanobacillus sp.]MCM3397968.1 hypothetical protein [Oceanobacillus profundus]PAE27422.1 hypothetical protein CHI07_19585 [Paenibacillus sp. 7884-2]RHW29504.1 hypothetical protein D1B32_21775 [Oceanobacillus profundus]